MRLNGSQLKQFYDALSSAFPTPGSLAQMVSFELDENLSLITGGQDYSEVVFGLLQWAKSKGKLEKLAIAALSANPNNPDLRKFAEQFLSDDASTNHASAFLQPNNVLSDSFIQQVREHCRQTILNQHSRMRLLNGVEVGVDQLYVDGWLLNRPPQTFQLSPHKLLENFDLRRDRLGLGSRIQRNPGFEIANGNAKLVILGKPGSGKTTFLKHLAIDWFKGDFQPNLITVLIEFRRIRGEHWNLLKAIDKELNLGNGNQLQEIGKQIQDLTQIKDTENNDLMIQQKEASIKMLKQQIEDLPLYRLLKEGKLLILMDGLDEIPITALREKVQEQIEELASKYPKNRFILTCRTQIMVSIPSGFISMEVADFNEEQANQFAQNWFTANNKSVAEALRCRSAFDKAIVENLALRELTATPLLLSLMCWLLQDEGEIPSQISWLYKKGIRLLLNRWNEAKTIDGWEVGSKTYQKLSIEQKEALLISIAARKFENPNNFVLFEQDEIATYITHFLRLTNPKEGVSVLKAIEAQHGLLVERADELWSFSHLTFQEYFTVQWLTQRTTEQLATIIPNTRWQEVIKQLVKSQQPADLLVRLIQRTIAQSISNEPNLQNFLTWVFQKSRSIKAHYCPEAIRAFYFALALPLTRDLASDFALNLDFVLDLALALNLTDFAPDINLDLSFSFYLNRNYDLHIDGESSLVDDLALTLAISGDLASAHARLRTHTLECFSVEHVRDSHLDQELLSEIPLDLDLAWDLDPFLNSDCKDELDSAISRILNPEHSNQIEQIRQLLSRPSLYRAFQQWWRVNGFQWVEDLRQLMVQHRNIGHDWHFTEEDKRQLQQYYNANKFLVDLVDIPEAVSVETRDKILESLLLPWEALKILQPDCYL